MPGCAAVGCNNRSEKGYIMKCFPRDTKLRKIWEERVSRADWEPSNNSFLCHVHFEPQEWSVTQTGRIRLRKNAVPSIFTVTSTRKSPKKKIKTSVSQSAKELKKKSRFSYLDNKIDSSLYIKQSDKDSDFLDTDDLSVESIEYSSVSPTMEVEEKECNGKLTVKADPDIHDNVVTVSDGNLMDIDAITKHSNITVEMNCENKNKEIDSLPVLESSTKMTAKSSETVVKMEVKSEVMEQSVLADCYDEIEEKLKQICDGGSTEDENCTMPDKHNSSDKQYAKISNTACELSKSELGNGDSKMNAMRKTEISQILTEKQENVEIIFGKESEDERRKVHHSVTLSKESTEKVNIMDESRASFCEVSDIKQEKKAFTGDIEENFTKDEVHVIPNIRAAMKRKKRTREEIMKSIKKSIKSTSDREVSSSGSDISEIIDSDIEVGDDLSVSSCQTKVVSSNKAETAAKFVIKVTGDPSDVTEIMDELSSNSLTRQPPQKFTTACVNSQNDELITSIITVYSPLSSKEMNDSDSNYPALGNECLTLNRITNIDSVHSGPQEQDDHVSRYRHSITSLDEDDRNVVSSNNSCAHCCLHGVQSSTATISSNLLPFECGELLERIRLQEEVISKLTDQLIIYKELEANLKSKNSRELRESDNLPHKMNTRSSTAQSASSMKKNLECKQRLIEDLSNRANYFEETNKKLMKTVTLESQQRRNLEGQLKQKDNRIKELNWKLEKASKYLERAEKNTNTYRRKMLNMQTIMRRKKLLDEKMNKFNEMLGDSSKQEYTDKDFAMAAEIRKTCGRTGYDKLLSYGFPLPPLSVLRKKLPVDQISDNEHDDEKVPNSSYQNYKFIKVEKTESKSELDAKGAKVFRPVVRDGEFDGAETVTGTVQDIFDENNDGDDFSTNELREHFILQLNAVM